MQQTPDELRQQATKIRHAAQHAERLSDARAELALADQLEARANQLEGKTQHKPAPPEIPKAERERMRQKRIDAAMRQIEERFGRKG